MKEELKELINYIKSEDWSADEAADEILKLIPVEKVDSDEKLNQLIKGCLSEVSVTSNPHRGYYQSAEEYINEKEDVEDSLVRDKMIATETIIEVQFYPFSAISFYTVYHHDLNLALDEALRLLNMIKKEA